MSALEITSQQEQREAEASKSQALVECVYLSIEPIAVRVRPSQLLHTADRHRGGGSEARKESANSESNDYGTYFK